MDKLTTAELTRLRSLPDSELRSFLDQVRAQNPDLAEDIRRQVKSESTRTDVADYFGVAVDTIDVWNRKGCPHEGKKGSMCWYFIPDVAKWLARQKVIKVGNEELEKLEKELKAENLKLKQIERQRKDGTLVNRQDVEKVLHHVMADIRNRVAEFHSNYGDDAVEQLNDIVDDAIEHLQTKFDEVLSS